jgi:tetratricopeptide (TPR) repeat protein/DNA-binding CsgD family transcriptional regulator
MFPFLRPAGQDGYTTSTRNSPVSYDRSNEHATSLKLFFYRDALPPCMVTLKIYHYVIRLVLGLCAVSMTACLQTTTQDNDQLERAITVIAKHDWRQRLAQPDSILRNLESLQSLHASQRPLDLRTELQLTQLKARIYRQLDNLDSVIYYAQRSNETALELGDTAQIISTLLIVPFNEFSRLQTRKLEKWIPLAVRYLERKTPVDNRHGNIFHLYGIYHYSRANYREAQRWLWKAYSIHRQHNDLSALGNLNINFGNLYIAINSPEKAIEFQRQAIFYIRQLGDPFELAGAINNLGTTYRKINPDSAVYYFRYVIDSLPGADDYVLMAKYNLANVYVEQGILQQEALQLYADVRQKSEAMRFTIGVLYADLGFAFYYSKNKYFPKALSLYEAAAIKADNLGLPELAAEISNNVIDVLEDQGRYEESYRLLQKQQLWKDSVTNLQTQVAIHDLELFYESENQKLANKKLLALIENQRLSIRNRSLLVGIVIIVMVFFIFLYWRAQRQKASKLEKLNEKYRLLAKLEKMKSAQATFYEQLIAQQQQEIMTIAHENNDMRLDLTEKQLHKASDGDADAQNLPPGQYWQYLALKFNLLYPGFIDQLQKHHARLTQSDLQLCMLTKLRIPNKEMAVIFNITIGSLYKKKYRLEEKMNLRDKYPGLEEYLEQL